MLLQITEVPSLKLVIIKLSNLLSGNDRYQNTNFPGFLASLKLALTEARDPHVRLPIPLEVLLPPHFSMPPYI